LCCWSATACSVVISMLLEFAMQARGRFRLVRPLQEINNQVSRWSEPQQWTLATVGDLLWMYQFYRRWLQKGDTLDKAQPGSSLPLLLRNPLFVLDDPLRRLSHYPTDPAAQRQMLFFLATSSSSLRKYLSEQVAAISAVAVEEWVRFLGATVMTWAGAFAPAEPEDEDAARQFLEGVVLVWQMQAVRVGLYMLTTRNPGQAISDLPGGMSLLMSHRTLAQALDSVVWRTSVFDGMRWCGVPSFPVCFSRESVQGYTKILNTELDRESGGHDTGGEVPLQDTLVTT